MKVLIAEADPILGQLCQLFLEKVESKLCHNIEDALDLLETFKPDKVVICGRLPHKNGNLINGEGVNVISKNLSIPVIVITGGSFKQIKQKQNIVFLEKPFSYKQLCNAVIQDCVLV